VNKLVTFKLIAYNGEIPTIMTKPANIIKFNCMEH